MMSKNTGQNWGNNDRYQALFKYSLNGIAFHRIIYDASNKPVNYMLLDVNPAFERILSVKKEAVVDKLSSEAYNVDEPPYLEIYAEVAETGKSRSFETYFPPMNKHFKITAFSFAKGQFITVFEDITETKQAEEVQHIIDQRLKASLKLSRMESISEQEITDFALEEGVKLTKSKIGYLHFINEDQKSVRLFSWSKEALKTCTAEQDQHYPIEKAGVWVDCVRKKRPILHNDYQNLPNKKGYPEGHVQILRHMSIPIFEKGKIVAVIGVGNKETPYNQTDVQQLSLFISHMWDILKRKRAEKALRQSERQYHTAYNRAEFYKDILSHDIGNFLHTISLSIDMALSGSIDTEILGDELSNIRNQVKSAAKLICNIRLLSSLEEREIQLESVELLPILQEGIDFTKASYQKREIRIQMQSSKENLVVRANSLLVNVFKNILHNAVKYCQGSITEIIIRLSREHKNGTPYIKIEFLDNGIGVPDERKESIFQRAFKEDRSVSGMGIGLSLVKKLVESYHGAIWVEDRVPEDFTKGSNFILLIPEAQ